MAKKPPSKIMGMPLPDAGKPVGIPASPNKEVSVSTRRISNGYVTRKDVYDTRTGAFDSTETFHEKPPKIEVSS